MAKLKAHPKTYQQAREALAGRESVKLGNNTYLELVPMSNENNLPCDIAVRLHNVNIVVFHADGSITLHTYGRGADGITKHWHTVTTKDRINEFISGRVYQQDHQWYYREYAADGSPYDVIFAEGMNVGQVTA